MNEVLASSSASRIPRARRSSPTCRASRSRSTPSSTSAADAWNEGRSRRRRLDLHARARLRPLARARPDRRPRARPARRRLRTARRGRAGWRRGCSTRQGFRGPTHRDRRPRPSGRGRRLRPDPDPRRRPGGPPLRRDDPARLRLHRPGDDRRGRLREGAADGARRARDRRARARRRGRRRVDRRLHQPGRDRHARPARRRPPRGRALQRGDQLPARLAHGCWTSSPSGCRSTTSGSTTSPGCGGSGSTAPTCCRSLLAEHGDHLAGAARLPGPAARGARARCRRTTCATSTRTTPCWRSSSRTAPSPAPRRWRRSSASCSTCTATRRSSRSRPLLEQRGGAYYSEAATGLVASLASGDGAVHVVDVRNDGTLEGLAADDVVEVPARVDRDGARPLPQPPLAPELLGLVQHVAAYERLAVDGGRSTRDPAVARKALLAHPLDRPDGAGRRAAWNGCSRAEVVRDPARARRRRRQLQDRPRARRRRRRRARPRARARELAVPPRARRLPRRARGAARGSRRAGPRERPRSLRSRSCSLAGVDFPAEEREVELAAARSGWARRTTVRNDTFAVLRAGTDRGWGVAVVCGAGHQLRRRRARRPARALSLPRRDHRGLGRWLRRRARGACPPPRAARTAVVRQTASKRAVPAHFGLASPLELARGDPRRPHRPAAGDRARAARARAGGHGRGRRRRSSSGWRRRWRRWRGSR